MWGGVGGVRVCVCVCVGGGVVESVTFVNTTFLDDVQYQHSNFRIFKLDFCWSNTIIPTLE